MGKQKTISIRAKKDVISYYYPEVRREISRMVKKYPHEVFMRWATSSLDDFHIPIINKYIARFSPLVSGLGEYPFRYATSGASEGIFHSLAKIKSKDPEATIYALRGEYQGFSEYANSLGLKFVESDSPENLPPGYWFISSPSARDGNRLPQGFVESICDAGHKVFLDLTYAGLTESLSISASHKNIQAVFASLSKPMGVYSYRIGFTFSREPIDSLYGNKWFKNIFSLLLAGRLLGKFAPDKLISKYRKMQAQVVAFLREKTGLPFEQSDVVLLATIRQDAKLTDEQRQAISGYLRGDFYRFCLTPYFIDFEKNGGVENA